MNVLETNPVDRLKCVFLARSCKNRLNYRQHYKMYIKTVLTLRQAQFKQTGGKKNFDKQPHHSEVDYS